MFHVTMCTLRYFGSCLRSMGVAGGGRVAARFGEGSEGNRSCNLAKIPLAD